MPFDANPLTPDLPVVYTPDAATQVLIAARNRLLQVGWIRGTRVSAQGYCSIGAILGGAGKGRRFTETERIAIGRLQLACGWKVVEVWNDYGRRTKEEVIATFDRAIDYRL